MSQHTVSWFDYNFTVVPCASRPWRFVNSFPGIYMFCQICQIDAGLVWRSVYIGQSDNVRQRLRYHERWNQAVCRGAWHVHVLFMKDRPYRDVYERFFICLLNPPLNKHHRNRHSAPQLGPAASRDDVQMRVD